MEMINEKQYMNEVCSINDNRRQLRDLIEAYRFQRDNDKNMTVVGRRKIDEKIKSLKSVIRRKDYELSDQA